MSQENVEIVRRVSYAYNRRDVEAMLDELHPEIEWHPWLQTQIGGAATMYRGHQGVRKGIRELEEAFSEIQSEPTEIRDLGERVVAIGCGSQHSKFAIWTGPICGPIGVPHRGPQGAGFAVAVRDSALGQSGF